MQVDVYCLLCNSNSPNNLNIFNMDVEEIYQNFNKIDENWIYRYRSISALSLKELMYNEIYFSYSDELNDPLDLGAEIIINKGSSFVYDFLLSGAFKSINIPRGNDLSEETQDFIKQISSQYSKTTNNIKILFTEENKLWLYDQFSKSTLKIEKFDIFFHNLLNVISNLLPNNLLSVSFSNDYINPLLWSIYGDKHQGFCAIFSPTDQKLKIKISIESEFEEYKCQSVNYSSDINVDLSLMFNEENEFDYKNLYNAFFPKLIEKALLTKNSNWYKENEIRIHKSPKISFSHLPTEPVKLTVMEKTCYFEPSQFVGVIFGYKMKNDQRNEIIKIFESKKQSAKIFEAIPVGNDIEVKLLRQTGYY